MRLNPIIKKDVKVQSRSYKMCVEVFVYEIIMALVFFVAMIFITRQNRYSDDNVYASIVWLYPVLAVTQWVILGVIIPIHTSSAISGEKERQTFDIMMTTSMTPWSIIMGKVMTAVLQGMLFVVASVPVMALTFVVGGLSWSYLFWFIAVALLVSLFAASIGIMCSSICRKSITAVIVSYGIYMIFFIVTALPVYLIGPMTDYTKDAEDMIGCLLLNPAVYLAEFVGQTMTQESMIGNMIDQTKNMPIMKFLSSGYWWLIVSTIVFVAISVIFLAIAAKRISPVSKSKAAKLAKKQMSGN